MVERDLAEWDREIEANFQRAIATTRAAGKRKRKTAEPFVKVPLWWIRLATEATRTPKALVAIELLRASWKAQSTTFALPSGRLKQYGLSRTTIWRALQQLKAAGLVAIELHGQKAPLITFPVAP
jgi:HTH domain